jgi:hypothetical protein
MDAAIVEGILKQWNFVLTKNIIENSLPLCHWPTRKEVTGTGRAAGLTMRPLRGHRHPALTAHRAEGALTAECAAALTAPTTEPGRWTGQGPRTVGLGLGLRLLWPAAAVEGGHDSCFNTELGYELENLEGFSRWL